MKLNNLQILNIYSILKNKYEELNDIKAKWKLALLSEEIFKIKSRFDLEKNNIIEEYGVENDNEVKSLDVNDKHIQELLLCESEISPVSLEELGDFLFTMEELIVLKPIIKI